MSKVLSDTLSGAIGGFLQGGTGGAIAGGVLGFLGSETGDSQSTGEAEKPRQGEMSIWAAAQLLGTDDFDLVKQGDKDGNELISMEELDALGKELEGQSKQSKQGQSQQEQGGTSLIDTILGAIGLGKK